MAVPKPHNGPTADKDRDWHWSEEGAKQVDAMLEQGGWKLVAEAHACTTAATATRRRRRAPTSCPTTSSSTAASRWCGGASPMP